MGLLLAQCYGGGSWGPWPQFGVDMGHCAAVLAPLHPASPVPARHDVSVAWGVWEAAWGISAGTLGGLSWSLGEQTSPVPWQI